MDDEEVFEGFGTSKKMTTQPHPDDTIADWANMLVDKVFNDPDCERLQVTSIVSTIQEIGFPIEYASKVRHLEQQLDPKSEGVTVDKPTLRKVVRLWLKSFHEETNVEECNSVLISTKDDHLSGQARFYVDVHNKDDQYKNEISCLHTTLNAYEDKMKILLLENDLLKKSMKKSKAANQKAEEDKVLAEESKATIEETLKFEKSRRSTEVSALDKQLVLVKDHLEILSKENLGYDGIIRDLQDELVVKRNELEEIVEENGVMKLHLAKLEERLRRAEKEITLLTNTNFELVEHGKEWKKTIQNLKEEKNALSKKLIIISSRIKTGKNAGSSNSDFGSDSSNIGEVSLFSPTYFSSPLASEKLSIELAGSLSQEPADMESTNRIPRTVNHPSEETAALIPDQKHMRKRKLFAIQPLISYPAPKRYRSDDGEAACTVFNNCVCESALAKLPLERSTSFAINLTMHQKLLKSLRQALCLHPHLFGCIRDFVACQVGNSTSGTELLDTDLTSLFYKFCTSQLTIPFRGRQLLRVICEELPPQSSSSALQRCHFIEQLNNEGASQNTQAFSYILEFENRVSSKAVQTIYPLPITECQSRGIDSTNVGLGGQYTKALDKLTLSNNMYNLKGFVSELDMMPAPAIVQKEPSSFAIEENFVIASISVVAGIKDNCINNCAEFSNNTPEWNECTFELELISKSLLGNQGNLVPTYGEKSEKSYLESSDTQLCTIPTSSQEFHVEGSGEGQAIGCIDFDSTDMLPKNASLLYNSISEMIVDLSLSSSTVITTPALVTGAVNNETQLTDISSESADESYEEFRSSRCLSIDPSFELYSDCTSEQSIASSMTYLKTLDSQVNSGIVSPHGDHSGPEITPVAPDLASPADFYYKPVKSRPCRYFKFIMMFAVFICFVPFFLFFALIFLAKTVLPEEEYISLLLALGGKYHRHETLLY